MDVSQPWLTRQAGSLTTVFLGYLRHTLPVQPDFADAFDSGENVIHSLAAHAHQFRAHDARHEIARQIENLLRRRAIQSLAKNGRHRTGKRLHFRTKRHANVCLAVLIHLQINADGIGAFLVFSHVHKIELVRLARFLVLRAVRVRHERLASFIFGERLKEVDDLVQFVRIHHIQSLPLILFRHSARSRAILSYSLAVTSPGCFDFTQHDVWLRSATTAGRRFRFAHKMFVPNCVMKTPIKVAVTGAAGHIGYALLFRIASGQMFGSDQPLRLHLIEIPAALGSLEGVVMELDDCAFPLLESVIPTADLAEGFREVDWALLVGSVPRKAGMERKDLLGINGKIFIGQGQAIQKNAAADVRVLVVGNPCNTNCLIAMNNARDIPRDRWFAMTRLDENRARAQLAHKAGASIRSVTNMTIWGNHSSTQYPDFYNARIDGRSANEVIGAEKWLKEDFIAAVQQRGAAVIKARGLSSAGSAANAIVNSVSSLINDTPGDDWHSVAVCSDGSYGVEKGLISSFPVRVRGGKWEIVQGLSINEFSREKINASVAELKEEKSLVSELIS